jgi:hypothetical protein
MNILYHLLETSRVVDCGLFYDALTVLGYTGHLSLQASAPDYSVKLSFHSETAVSHLNGRRPDDAQV